MGGDLAMKELLSLAYLRAGAAGFIVLFHAAGRDDVMGQGPLEGIFALGASRVDIFFVISGLVLWLSTATKDPAPLPFLAQRMLRIAPLYWIVTLALGGTGLLIPAMFPNLRTNATDIVLSLLFIPHFSPTRPDRIWPVLVQGWALHYEVAFYLLMTLALFVGRSWRLPALTGAFLLLVLAGLVLRPTSAVGLVLTDPLLLEFLGGVLFAAWWLTRPAVSRRAAWILLGAAIVALVIGTILAQNWLAARFALLGIPALMLVAAALMLEQGRAWPVWPRFLELGRASYSIYLTHGFVIAVLARLWLRSGLPHGGIGAGLVFVLVCTAVGMLVGLVVYRLVEKPLADRLRPPAGARTATAVKAAG